MSTENNSRRNIFASPMLTLLLVFFLYFGSYAVLRLKNYFIRGHGDEGDSMWAKSSRELDNGAVCSDGKIQPMGSTKNSPASLPVISLYFYYPMIQLEDTMRDEYYAIKHGDRKWWTP